MTQLEGAGESRPFSFFTFAEKGGRTRRKPPLRAELGSQGGGAMESRKRRLLRRTAEVALVVFVTLAVPSLALAGDDYITNTQTGQSIIPGATDIGNHCDDCVTEVSPALRGAGVFDAVLERLRELERQHPVPDEQPRSADQRVPAPGRSTASTGRSSRTSAT